MCFEVLYGIERRLEDMVHVFCAQRTVLIKHAVQFVHKCMVYGVVMCLQMCAVYTNYEQVYQVLI